jgi:hypothetical protein
MNGTVECGPNVMPGIKLKREEIKQTATNGTSVEKGA